MSSTPAEPMTPARLPSGSGETALGRAMLDPRALPTDMGLRFALLIATVAAAALYLFDALWFVLRGRAFLVTALDCGLGVDPLASGSVADTSAQLQAQAACRAQTSLEQALFAGLGVLAVFAVAYLTYLVLPRWRETRSRLEPLDPLEGAVLHAEVERIGREAGLARTPDVMVDAVNPRVQAFVYGTRRRPRLALTGGLAVQQALDPPAFRAVLRHELAHLANRDVPWTYFTLAVWWSFLAVALLPVVVLFAISDPQYVVRLGWRTAALSLMVLLVRNSVLRAREVYADALAAASGARGDLDRVLAGQPGDSGARSRLLRRHPDPEERRRLLADPDGLFRADLFITLAAAVAAGSAFHSLQSVAALVLPIWAAVWLPALALAVPTAAVMCVAAWRCALRSVVRAAPVPAVIALGAGTGAGLALGPWLSFDAAAGGFVDGPQGVLGYLLWAFATAAVMALLARYTVDVGHAALDSAVRRSSPWPVLVPHAVATVAVVAAVLAFGHVTLLYLTGLGPRAALSTWQMWAYLPSVLGPWDNALPALVVVGLLVAAALVARGLLRPAATRPARWPWREEPPASLPATARPPLAPPLVAGLLAGTTAGLGHVAARYTGAAALDDAIWRSDAYRVSLGLGTVGLLAAAAVIASAAGALVLPRRWWPLGIIGGASALAVGAALSGLAFVAAGCGVLPRAGPADCAGLRLGELGLLLGQPTDFAVLPAALAAALVGALGRDSARRSGPRLLAVVTAAVVLTGAGSGLLSAYVARTQVATLTAPGYQVALPPMWEASAPPGEAPVLATLDRRVRVMLLPVAAPARALGEERPLLVGGVQAHLVARQVRGLLEVRAYDLTAPSGDFRLVVLGTPEALDAADTEELAALLAGIRWTRPG